jgi:di/tricarboxylate transporter
VSTLVGAGSHLIANDLLEEFSGRRISFAEWALYGVPFGLAAALVSCLVVSRVFLRPATRALPLTVPAAPRTAWSMPERRTGAVTLAMVALWVSESVHGVEVATVAVAGAVALTAPGIGVLSWKDGVKAVEWNLVVFVGAALVLGEALIDSGAAGWIVERLFAASGIAEAGSELVVLVVLALLTLTSHVYMTSHAARAAALVPALLYLGTSLDLDPVALVFIGTVGMDYCLTFPVSSKALLLYAELDEDTFEPPDLLRLSSVLLLAHVVLVVVFYLLWWRPLGLAL